MQAHPLLKKTPTSQLTAEQPLTIKQLRSTKKGYPTSKDKQETTTRWQEGCNQDKLIPYLLGGQCTKCSFEYSWGWITGFHSTWRNGDSTLRGHTKNLMCTRTQGKKQCPYRRQSQTSLLVLKGPWQVCGVAVAHCWNKNTGNSSSGKYPLE